MAVNNALVTQYQNRLTLYLEAESTILSGAQSYTIGNRTLTRPDLKYIQSEISNLEKKIVKLSNGNRIRLQRARPRDR